MNDKRCFSSWQTEIFFLILWFLSPSLHSFHPSHILPCSSLLYPVEFFFLSYLHIHSYALFLNTLFWLSSFLFLFLYLPILIFFLTHNMCLEYSNTNFNCCISSQFLSGKNINSKILVVQYFQEKFKIMLFLWNTFIYLQLILILKNDGHIITFMN